MHKRIGVIALDAAPHVPLRETTIALVRSGELRQAVARTSRDLKLHTHSSLGCAAHVTKTERLGWVPITRTADRGPTSSVRWSSVRAPHPTSTDQRQSRRDVSLV
jgi:hypothetical protein